jgi:hypothetical protein
VTRRATPRAAVVAVRVEPYAASASLPSCNGHGLTESCQEHERSGKLEGALSPSGATFAFKSHPGGEENVNSHVFAITIVP